MALVKWSEINNMFDLLAYVKAETDEARAKCSVAYPQYVAAYQYLLKMMTTPTSNEANFVRDVKAMVEAARVVWRANCPVAAQVTPPVVVEKTESEPEPKPGPEAGASGGGIGKWLILGAVGVGLYFLLRRK